MSFWRATLATVYFLSSESVNGDLAGLRVVVVGEVLLPPTRYEDWVTMLTVAGGGRDDMIETRLDGLWN